MRGGKKEKQTTHTKKTHPALIEIPQHCNAVLAARGAQGAIGGHGDRVEVARVPREGATVPEVDNGGDADLLVPPSGDNLWGV